MKILVNSSFGYAVAGLASGLYYRELTKAQDFDGPTQLSILHTHLLVLGVLVQAAELAAREFPRCEGTPAIVVVNGADRSETSAAVNRIVTMQAGCCEPVDSTHADTQGSECGSGTLGTPAHQHSLVSVTVTARKPENTGTNSLTIGVLATSEDSNIYGLAIPFVIPAGFALVGGVAAVRAVRQPLYVTREERAQLLKAHRRTGFEAVGNRQDCGDAQKIAYLADHVIADIGKSAAWKSRLLDEHRIRLDLDRELYEIVSSAAILDKQMRANAVDRDILVGGGPEAEGLLQAVKRNAGLISEMRASLVRRVAALLAYRNELAPLDRLIKQMQALDQLEQQEEGLREAYTQITLNEMAASETVRMSDELTVLRANLTAQIEYLRTNVINNPLLGTGLSLTDKL